MGRQLKKICYGIFTIGSVLSIIAVIAWFVSFRNTFKGKPINTTVQLKEIITRASGFGGIYSYNCNSKTFEYIGTHIATSVVGDRFLANYDSLDCENIEIFYEKPVFLSDEKTGITTGEIYFNGSFTANIIKYTYIVDGKQLERMQYMEKGYIKKFPAIENGAKFKVQFWEENPQRSIMLFEN